MRRIRTRKPTQPMRDAIQQAAHEQADSIVRHMIVGIEEERDALKDIVNEQAAYIKELEIRLERVMKSNNMMKALKARAGKEKEAMLEYVDPPYGAPIRRRRRSD